MTERTYRWALRRLLIVKRTLGLCFSMIAMSAYRFPEPDVLGACSVPLASKTVTRDETAIHVERSPTQQAIPELPRCLFSRGYQAG